MAIRQSMPNQGSSFVAGAAIVMLAAWHTGPAFAATSSSALCDDVADLTFRVPAKELQANEVSHDVDTKVVAKTEHAIDTLPPSHYLAPRVNAALREMFKDKTAALSDSDTTEGSNPPVMKTYVPGVSDEELAQYKRQMYRTDI